MSDSVSVHSMAVGKDAKAPPGNDAPRNRRWWLLDATKNNGQEVADAVESTIRFLKGQQGPRLMQATVAARLYGNAPLGGLGGAVGASQALMGPMFAARENLKENWTQSVIDTSTATIGENRPRPYFLTDGGDYKLQRQAKKLNQFCEGIFYEQKAYELGGEAQRDCEVFGDGLVYVGVEHGRLKYRRVLAVELWLDEDEGMLAMPRQLHWERLWDKEEIIGLFPKKADLIWKTPRADTKDFGGRQTNSDMIVVRHSWHLRSAPEMQDQKGKRVDDGVCVTSIDHAVLTEPEECRWQEDFYPLATWKWCPRPSGWWSQGLAEQLQSQQIEYNKLAGTVQRCMHRAGGYKVFLEAGSKVVKEHLSNEVGAIIEYRGTKPEYVSPVAIDPRWFERLDSLKHAMFERAGISIQTATGEKPAGLNSGEAQRVYRDTVQLRMKTQERLNERGYIDLAKVSIAMAKRIAEKSGHYEVRTPAGRALKSIRMTAKELDPSDWRLQCFPTSSLPKDPAGRLATVQEYIQAGFMTPRQGRRALDFPDLEAVESLANAAEDLLTSILDDIADEGRYRPPEPTDNLQLAKELVVEYINRGRLHNLDAEKLDLLHMWNEQVNALMQLAMPPPMPSAQGALPGGGAPQAQPMSAPPSNLLPFAA